MRQRRREQPRSLLTLREAATRLGMWGKLPALRLRRLLMAHERLLGQRIMVRVGERQAGRGTRLLVRLSAIRQACPKLFPKRDQMAEQLREEMDNLHDKVSELFLRDSALFQAVNRVQSECRGKTRENSGGLKQGLRAVG